MGGGLGNMMGMMNPGGFGFGNMMNPQQPQQPQQSNTNQYQGQGQPNNMGSPFGFGMNPMMMGLNNPFMMGGMNMNPMQQKPNEPESIEAKYKSQLK